jgi:hypothetical protein
MASRAPALQMPPLGTELLDRQSHGFNPALDRAKRADSDISAQETSP